MNEGSYCEEALLRDTWAPWSAKGAQWRDCAYWQAFCAAKKNKAPECLFKVPANNLDQCLRILCGCNSKKERPLIEWSHLFMQLSLFKECKTNYCGYWINSAVAHNWFENIKCLLPADSIFEKTSHSIHLLKEYLDLSPSHCSNPH